MIFARRLLVILIVSGALTLDAHAGLLASIAKLASKVDVPELKLNKLDSSDFHNLGMNLPQGTSPALIRTRIDANNHWVLTDSAGNHLSNLDDISNPVLVISKAHIPRDLSKLDALPRNIPLLIQVDKHLYRLEKQISWVLKAGGAGIKVQDYAGLHKAIWHFKTPWANGPIRILGLKDQPAHSLAISEGVTSNALKNAPQQLRGQTVVLVGSINNGNIKVAGEQFSLGQLRNQADQYDLSLIVLESSDKLSAVDISRRIKLTTRNGVPQSTGEFLSNIVDPSANTIYEIAASGKNQVLISQQTITQATTTTPGPATSVAIAVRLGIRAAIIFRPSESRQSELNLRILPWLPSLVGIYLLVSSLIGIYLYRRSNAFLGLLWPSPSRERFPHPLAFYPLAGLRFTVLLGLVIPIFGLLIGVYRLTVKVVLAIIWVFNRFIVLMVWLMRALGLLNKQQK